MLLFIQLYAILFYLAIGNASPMLFFFNKLTICQINCQNGRMFEG